MDPVFVLLGWSLSVAIAFGSGWLIGHYRGHTLGKIEATAQQALDHAKAAVASTAQNAANAVTGALGQSGPKRSTSIQQENFQ